MLAQGLYSSKIPEITILLESFLSYSLSNLCWYNIDWSSITRSIFKSFRNSFIFYFLALRGFLFLFMKFLNIIKTSDSISKWKEIHKCPIMIRKEFYYKNIFLSLIPFCGSQENNFSSKENKHMSLKDMVSRFLQRLMAHVFLMKKRLRIRV